MSTRVADHARRTLSNHTLAKVLKTPGVTLCLMTAPDRSPLSRVTILEADARLVITGCLHPGKNGAISDVGYDLPWFAGRLAEACVCEKFLAKEWCPDHIHKNLKMLLKEEREELTEHQVDEIEEALSDWVNYNEGPCTEAGAFHDWNDSVAKAYDPADIPGYDYNAQDAMWLCAIQQRFAELWQAEQR